MRSLFFLLPITRKLKANLCFSLQLYFISILVFIPPIPTAVEIFYFDVFEIFLTQQEISVFFLLPITLTFTNVYLVLNVLNTTCTASVVIETTTKEILPGGQMSLTPSVNVTEIEQRLMH